MIKERSNKTGPIEIDLDGSEGNAFAILALAKALCRSLDYDWNTVESEMMASDYKNLIRTFDHYFADFVVMYTDNEELLDCIGDNE